MRRLIRADKPLVREVWTRDRLIDWFKVHGESFKARMGGRAANDEG